MGKFEKKKSKKSRKGLLAVVILLIIAVILVLFVMPHVLYKLNNEESSDDSGYAASSDLLNAEADQAETAENIHALKFPLLLEDGKLEIDSVFQFDGLNPDCGNQSGDNIAAITLKNLSDEYLSAAEISLKSTEETELRFAVTNVPAGAAVIAFSVDNIAVDAETFYSDVVCDASFGANASMSDGAISAAVDGIHITLRNNTDADINEVVVYCHSTLGDQYFGGITYSYTANNLPANGTAELDAVDCILGLAEVVRIEKKQ